MFLFWHVCECMRGVRVRLAIGRPPAGVFRPCICKCLSSFQNSRKEFYSSYVPNVHTFVTLQYQATNGAWYQMAAASQYCATDSAWYQLSATSQDHATNEACFAGVQARAFYTAATSHHKLPSRSSINPSPPQHHTTNSRVGPLSTYQRGDVFMPCAGHGTLKTTALPWTPVQSNYYFVVRRPNDIDCCANISGTLIYRHIIPVCCMSLARFDGDLVSEATQTKRFGHYLWSRAGWRSSVHDCIINVGSTLVFFQNGYWILS